MLQYVCDKYEKFYEMIYNDTINLLHDFKDIVLKK